MLGKTNNAILQQIEQGIQAKVDPAKMNDFQRIVTAGLKIMYDPKTHPLMVRQLSKQGDPADIAGDGAASLVALIYKESKHTMPIKEGVLASQIWLCEGLDFMAQSGKIQITNDLVARATKSLMAHILQLFKIDPRRVNQAALAGQAAQGQSAKPPGIIAGAQQ